MEYEVVVYHTIIADSHKDAVEKYLDNEMDIEFHEIYWYDTDGTRIKVDEDLP